MFSGVATMMTLGSIFVLQATPPTPPLIRFDDNAIVIPYESQDDISKYIRFEEAPTIKGDLCNMPSQSENLKLLDSFKELDENWNGYDSKPLSDELIEKMRTLVWLLPIQPEIFPTARESIQFEFDCDNGSHIEFEMFSDRTICVLEVDSNRNLRESQLTYDVPAICEAVSEFYARNAV